MLRAPFARPEQLPPTMEWDVASEVALPEIISDFSAQQDEILLDPLVDDAAKQRILGKALRGGGEFSRFAAGEPYQVTPETSVLDIVDGRPPHARLLDAGHDYIYATKTNHAQLTHDSGRLWESLTPLQRAEVNSGDARQRLANSSVVYQTYRQTAERADDLQDELSDYLQAALHPAMTKALLSQPAANRLAWLEKMREQRETERVQAERQAQQKAAAERARAERQAKTDATAKQQIEDEMAANITSQAELLKKPPKPPSEQPGQLEKPSGKRFSIKKTSGNVEIIVRVPDPALAAKKATEAAKDAAESLGDLSDEAKDKLNKTVAAAGASAVIAATGLSGGHSSAPTPVVPGERNQAAQIQTHHRVPQQSAAFAARPATPRHESTGGAAPFTGTAQLSERQKNEARRIYAALHSKAPITKANRAAAVEDAQQAAQLQVAADTQKVAEHSLADSEHSKKTVNAIDQLALFTIAHRTHGEMTKDDVQKLSRGMAMVMLAARHPMSAELEARGLKASKHERQLAGIIEKAFFANAPGYTRSQKQTIALLWAKSTSASIDPAKHKQIAAEFESKAAGIAAGEHLQPTHHGAGTHGIRVVAANAVSGWNTHATHYEKASQPVLSPAVGKGMSAEARQKFRAIVTAAGERFEVPPNLVATMYYIEQSRVGDSTNNADSASGTPATGDGAWHEPPAPYGRGLRFRSSSVGAGGPGQFMPGTFRAEGVDGNGDGKKDPNNLNDGVKTIAKYLSDLGVHHGSTESEIRHALFGYNHDQTYVQSGWNVFTHLNSTANEAAARAKHAAEQQAQAQAEAAAAATKAQEQAAAEQQADAAAEQAPSQEAAQQAADPIVAEVIHDGLDAIKSEVRARENAVHTKAKETADALETQAKIGNDIASVVEAEYAKYGNQDLETAGPNTGDVIKKYTGGPQGPAYSWCNYFVTWAIAESGHKLTGGPAQANGRIPRVADFAVWLKDHGKLFSADSKDDKPQRGDAIMFSANHVGVVTRVDGDWVDFIAGNTSIDGTSNNGRTIGKRGLNYAQNADGLLFGRLTHP